MKRADYFLMALRAETFKRTNWVISLMSLIDEGPEDWRKDPYPYRLVRSASGYFYVSPEDTSSLVMIEGEYGLNTSQPLIRPLDRISLKAGHVPNLKEDVETTFGNVLINYIILIWPFGSKMPFQTGRISEPKLRQAIVDAMVDTPPVGTERDPNTIYVDEYLKYADSLFYLTAFTQVCVPASTEKTITPPPGVIELRTRLLEENKDRLHDPAVLASIDAQLVAYLKEWMKGDLGEGFLIGSKSYDVVRKKLYLIGGAEAGLDDNPSLDLVTQSLSEGWQLDKFHTLNTNSRAGSFNRGAQTELGGEAVKWLFRASSNMKVEGDDCGSKLGVTTVVNAGQERKLIGFTAIIDDNTQVKINKDNVGEYLGKRLTLRSPMYCKMPMTDYCKTCLGDRLATNPTGLSTAVAEYGSTFLALFMKSMHVGGRIKVAKMDYKSVIS
jgi:hypothetical protein